MRRPDRADTKKGRHRRTRWVEMGTSKRKRGVAIAAAVAAVATGAATGRLASADVTSKTAATSTRATLTGRLLVATEDRFGGGAEALQTSLRTASGTVSLRIPASRHARNW